MAESGRPQVQVVSDSPARTHIATSEEHDVNRAIPGIRIHSKTGKYSHIYTVEQ